MKTIPYIFGLSLLLFVGCEQTETKTTEETVQTKNTQKEQKMTKKNKKGADSFTQTDLRFLKHCLGLAREALEAGDQAFGSILVNENDEIIAEARNRVNEKNVLAHPEYELAEWAINNLSLEERKAAKMYTTGEHCPMCAGAHAWSQVGEMNYLSSAKQLEQWLGELNIPAAPIEFIPSEEIMKNVTVKGPAEGPLVEEIKKLHVKYYTQ